MEIFQQLLDFILNIDIHLYELVENYGFYIYLILFLILFAETGLVIMPFLPGDSLLFAAGALAAGGNMDVLLLILVCIAGAILGNLVNYYIGYWIGPKAFELKSRFLKKEYLLKTQQFYDKHGGKALIIGRYLPFIRTFVPFVAGIGHMNAAKFSLYNILGAFLWVVPIILLGFLFGNIPFIKDHFSLIILAILAISILPLIFGIVGIRKWNKN
ncbi:MAG: DedA family protein [Bacteroidota bacterium]|nr:DedA family protein [Bacteroidota bacterium]